MTISAGGSLARLIARTAPADTERCELCSAPLPAEHRHVLDLNADELRCTCRACALLFEREAAARGHYRLVPQRRIRLDAPDAEAETAAPVGLAFYVVQQGGTVLVRYPGPAGATTGVVDPDGWSGLVRCWPRLAELVPSVEAFLINTARMKHEHWIVPLDECYRLVAIIREHWSGLSGGRTVWPAVDEFFAALARPARGQLTVGIG